MAKLKIAIIGMGKMGRIRYDSFLRHGGYEIAAICDIHPIDLNDIDVPVYTDWQDCIENSIIDAIMVCTFNVYIPTIVCYALERGIHVFAEKPPGRKLSDTLRMQETYEAARAVLKFGFNHRYHNSIIEAKALIDSGLFGELVCARGVYGKAGSPRFEQEWRNDSSISGGGILLDQGIHLLDLLSYLMGDFTSIQSKVSNLVWKGLNTEDSALAILETSDGRVASLHSSAVQWRHKFDLDLICADGYIALNGLFTASQSYGEEMVSYYRKDLDSHEGRLGRPVEHTMVFDQDRSWDLEAAEFYEAVVYGKPLQHGTINQAVNVMALVERIYSNSL